MKTIRPPQVRPVAVLWRGSEAPAAADRGPVRRHKPGIVRREGCRPGTRAAAVHPNPGEARSNRGHHRCAANRDPRATPRRPAPPGVPDRAAARSLRRDRFRRPPDRPGPATRARSGGTGRPLGRIHPGPHRQRLDRTRRPRRARVGARGCPTASSVRGPGATAARSRSDPARQRWPPPAVRNSAAPAR